MDGQITANINQADCITHKSYLFHDVAYNVCTGKSMTMPWGIFDYMIVGILGFAFLILIMMIIIARMD